MKLFSNDIYDLRALKKYLLILGGFTVLSFITRGYIYVLFPAFVLAALARGKLIDLLFWVLVLCFTAVANPYIFPKNAVTFMIVRLSLVAIAGVLMMKVFGQRNAKIVAPFLGVFPYIVWVALISFQGFDPIVSYLKILLFVPIYLALYAVANEVTATTRLNAKAVRSAVLSIVLFIVFASVALLPFPGISQLQAMREQDAVKIARMVADGQSLFTGITNQSQALGPMLGVLLTIIFGDLILAVKRWDPLYLLTLLFGSLLIAKTGSRTGMGTFFAGVAMMLWLFTLARSNNARWKGKVMSGVFLVAILGCVGIFAIPSVRDKVLNFALKVQSNERQAMASDLTYENFTSSRQGLVEAAMYNFKKKPIVGNGFQVSEDMLHQKRTSIVNYMSAPIEKGVWPAAVLEEGGVPGLILFGGFLLICFATLIRRHAYIGAGALWVFTIQNLGEFNFFSMSFTGGFEWAFVFAAVILDGQRMKSVGLQVFEVPMEVIIAEEGIDMYTRRLA